MLRVSLATPPCMHRILLVNVISAAAAAVREERAIIARTLIMILNNGPPLRPFIMRPYREEGHY